MNPNEQSSNIPTTPEFIEGWCGQYMGEPTGYTPQSTRREATPNSPQAAQSPYSEQQSVPGYTPSIPQATSPYNEQASTHDATPLSHEYHEQPQQQPAPFELQAIPNEIGAQAHHSAQSPSPQFIHLEYRHPEGDTSKSCTCCIHLGKTCSQNPPNRCENCGKNNYVCVWTPYALALADTRIATALRRGTAEHELPVPPGVDPRGTQCLWCKLSNLEEKCDEGRPKCQRCTDWFRVCEYSREAERAHRKRKHQSEEPQPPRRPGGSGVHR
jgi:hypothetical protein